MTATMFLLKFDADMSINSKLLLNSDEKALEKLLRQLKIDPNSLTEMIRIIQEWYERNAYLLPEEELHDQLITRLLIMRKFNIEKVKEKIHNYISVRHEMGKILSNRDPMEAKLNRHLKSGHWIVLPKKTSENHRVTIFRIRSYHGISIIELIKVIFMITDYRLWNDTVMGEQCILDLENVTIHLAVQLSPDLISKIVFYVTSCIGPKLKGLHLVNLPFYATAAFDLFKKLMKPKLVARIHVYNNFKDVMQKFPENIFPKDLGGTDDVTCQEISDAWLETFSSNGWRKYFANQNNLRNDNAKKNDIKLDDNFGVQGSFKKLNID